MSTELERNLQSILSQKDTYLLPTNLRNGVTLLGVTGTLNEGKMTDSEYNNALSLSNQLLGITLSDSDKVDINFIDAFLDTIEDNVEYWAATSLDSIGHIREFLRNVNHQDLLTYWNSNIPTNVFPYLEQICFSIFPGGIYSYTSWEIAICFVQNNNNVPGSTLPRLWIDNYMINGNEYIFNDYFANSSMNYTSGKRMLLLCDRDGSFEFSEVQDITTTQYVFAFNAQVRSKNEMTYNISSSTCFIPCVFGYGEQSLVVSPVYSDRNTKYTMKNTNKIIVSSE